MPGTVLDELTPQLRVALAVTPFAVAMVMRVIFGRRSWARWLVTIATIWFAINVLLAPYAAGIRREALSLGSLLR